MPRKATSCDASTRTQSGSCLNWHAAFLAALIETGHVSRAAEAAGVDRRTVWRHRQDDPEFARAYDEAFRIAAVTLEDEAVRRAKDGVRRMKFNNKTGEPYLDPETGKPYIEHEYSDTLLLALLKKHFPNDYRERSQTNVNVGVGVAVNQITEERRADILRKKQEAIERRRVRLLEGEGGK